MALSTFFLIAEGRFNGCLDAFFGIEIAYVACHSSTNLLSKYLEYYWVIFQLLYTLFIHPFVQSVDLFAILFLPLCCRDLNLITR